MNIQFPTKITYFIGRTTINRSFKTDLKIKWVRPEKIPCINPEKSGDLSDLPPVSPKTLLPGYEDSKELQNANDTVKNMFTIGFNKRKHTSELYKQMFAKEVQRHPLDYGSMESKLAQMSARIRGYQQHLQQYPKNVKVKVDLKELIDKRKKFLKYLRRWDYKRFEWVLEKLDLVYKPPPELFYHVSRKDSLRKLVDIHCDNIKKERLDAYRKTLEGQREEFLEKKIANLQFILREQEECKVPVTINQDEINEAKRKLQELKAKREVLQSNADS